MGKLKSILLLASVWMTLGLQAQERNVSGKVTDAKDGAALSGVTVTNVKSGKRTLTDDQGRFTLAANSGDAIRFSFVGFATFTQNAPASGDMMVGLTAAASNLDEVVITAFGIRRQKRALGYATQEIKGDEVYETQRENFINSIQGRVAGATVNATSGAPGASSQIVLRGFNSLTGNNSPLFIVDGLPINNSTFSQGLLASDLPNRNDDYTNRGVDINPADIESITILKGPEATALYGIDAGSGAIVITTKKGRTGKLTVSYDNSLRIEHLYRFPEIQTKYSTGVNGVFDSTSRLRFGPEWPAGTQLYNNPEAFFESGFSHKHNLNLEGGKPAMTYRFNFTYQDQYGVIPTTRFQRIAPRVTIGNQISKNLNVTNTFSYTHSKNRKAFRGAGGFLNNLLLWPNNNNVKNWKDEFGDRVKIVDDPAFLEVDNPFWDVNRNRNEDVNDRYIYNLSISYDPLKWLNISARGGVDAYSQKGQYMYSPQSNAFYTVGGFIEYYVQDYRGLSGNLIATARNKIGPVKTTLRVGTAVDDFRTEAWSERAEDIGDYFDFNLATKPDKRQNSRTRGRDTLTQRRLQGVFGEVGLNYGDFLFVNITGRNDWTSTLPEASRSFFYPSVSTSFVFSDLFFKNSKVLTLGKLRASYAETAKDITPYTNQSVYTVQVTSGGGFLYDFRNNNPFIVPERQETFEFGTELRFFGDRFGLDATYYNTKNIGQIIQEYRLSYGTGFILNTGNVADTKNEGVEVVLNVMPIKKRDFSWRMNFNFNKMWNKITYLPGAITEYYNSDTWVGTYRAGIVLGGQTTTLTGANYLRNNAGDILINPTTNLPVIDGTYRVIADRMPDFTTGWQNVFTYKNWQLNFLIDFRFGGDIMNGNELAWYSNGLSKRTLDRELPRVINGVMRDGLENTSNPTRNTVAITPYFFQDYYAGTAVAADFVEKDVNWAWLRDVTLRYNLPESVMRKSKYFSRFSAFVTCTDAFVITNYTGLNPNGNGNTPSTRGVGSFGIDLGTTPNPLGFNFGIACTFKN